MPKTAKIKLHKSTVKTIRQGDPLFTIDDGFVRYQRAGFHILPECPRAYQQVIAECINNGWLKPVAYMTDREAMFEILATDN